MIFNSWKKKQVSSDKTKSLSKNTIKEKDNLDFNGIKLGLDTSPSVLGKEIKIVGQISGH